MMPQDSPQNSSERLEHLLVKALGVAEGERRALLEAEEADQVLIAEVLDLLENEDDSFMQAAPVEGFPGVEHAARWDESDDPEVPGYSIQSVLGEGGMGRVYLAVEEKTDQRLVALKMIRMPLPDPGLIRRFEAERRRGVQGRDRMRRRGSVDRAHRARP